MECDEAYVIAGHKGQPEVVKHKGRKGRRRRRKGKAGRGTMEKERPPVFGMIERGGQVVINLLANVQQKTIEPLMKDTIESGSVNIEVPKSCPAPQSSSKPSSTHVQKLQFMKSAAKKRRNSSSE